ncbi:hypothetical protein AALB53_24250, partial [Lachnospiraceae bacterium 47-T17]
NPKNSNPDFTGERHIFHYTFLFDAYYKTNYEIWTENFAYLPICFANFLMERRIYAGLRDISFSVYHILRW